MSKVIGKFELRCDSLGREYLCTIVSESILPTGYWYVNPTSGVAPIHTQIPYAFSISNSVQNDILLTNLDYVGSGISKLGFDDSDTGMGSGASAYGFTISNITSAAKMLRRRYASSYYDAIFSTESTHNLPSFLQFALTAYSVTKLQSCKKDDGSFDEYGSLDLSPKFSMAFIGCEKLRTIFCQAASQFKSKLDQESINTLITLSKGNSIDSLVLSQNACDDVMKLLSSDTSIQGYCAKLLMVLVAPYCATIKIDSEDAAYEAAGLTTAVTECKSLALTKLGLTSAQFNDNWNAGVYD